MAEPMGERMKSVEVHLEHIVKRLDNHDVATDALLSKLDTILANQAAGAEDRKAIRADIESMRPHVDSVADFKKYTKFGRLTIGVGAAIIGGLAYMKGWLIFNWNWFVGK